MFRKILAFAVCTTLTVGSLSSPAAHAGEDPFGKKFENYQCYRVLKSEFDYDRDRKVKVKDQFGDYQQFAAKLIMVCNPVDINGEGIKNPEVHLACFSTDPAANGRLKEQQVYVENRFGKGKVLLEKTSQLLCVTTIKKH